MSSISRTDIEEPLFVIEGIVTELHVSLGKENLLAQVDKHYQAKNIITGLGAVVGELYGQAAAGAAVAMYEGEYTENFLCLVGDSVVCGTFGGASKLPVGKKIKAVVTKQGDVLVAKGMLSESEGLVWVGHAWGYKAERMANIKIAFWCFLFQMFCIFCLCLFTGELGTPFFWAMMQISFFGGGALCFGVALWSGSTMSTLSDPATEVFRLLGFSEPEKVNLNSYQYGIVYIDELIHSDQTRANYGNIHCYKKAIEDGKIKLIS